MRACENCVEKIGSQDLWVFSPIIQHFVTKEMLQSEGMYGENSTYIALISTNCFFVFFSPLIQCEMKM